jgi:hypothetical protein
MQKSNERPTVEKQLYQIARQVGRIRPDWQNPERFFEERSDLETELRKIARQVSNG